MGMGEKTDALEPFHPDRLASRILGMGDVLSLIEEAERKVDKKAEKLARKKVKKGKGFDLEDFRDQLQQMSRRWAAWAACWTSCRAWARWPRWPRGPAREGVQARGGDHRLHDAQERRRPEIINGSRKRRIAAGAGLQVPDLNRLLKQHKQMQKMMKKAGKKGGMQKMMRGMQDCPGCASFR
jgi:signal recognition particle subunit SRP54